MISRLLLLCLPACLLGAADTNWIAAAPVLHPGAAGTFDEKAVKDPSIVFADGAWHVFYTARGRGRYSIGYVSAPKLTDLAKAPRHHLKQLRGTRDDYAAAPQVFYFRPHKKWYLIYQTTDKMYQPVFSTTAAISKPESWSPPQTLVEHVEPEKWIDFWVICDDTTAYLFYTRLQREVMVMTTPIQAFPNGFGNARKVFAPVHESVHVYRAGSRYLMLYETLDGALRKFGLASAASLAGPWTMDDDNFATGKQVRFASGVIPWTGEVSHGELLRKGFDQRMQVDQGKMRFLIQGMNAADHTGPYPELPWRLGVIELATR